MHIKLKRSPGIYLAGYMGSGKSTVGRLLADKLGWEFSDIDALIEFEQSCPIRDIFDQRGEPEFRRLESAAIAARVREVERGMPAVVALGGGAFVQQSNFNLIRDHGISIWLDCSLDCIRGRIENELERRPLARDPERFRELFNQRREAYSRADFRVDGDLSAPEIVDAILGLPLWK